MDKKFLHRVIDQVVGETIMNDGQYRMVTPFTYPTSTSYIYHSGIPSEFKRNFLLHCKNVYGLNGIEIDYVWQKYKSNVFMKIKKLHKEWDN